jgi:hypothetical protein
LVHFDSTDRKQRYDYHLVKSAHDADWSLVEILIRDLRTGRVMRRMKAG